MRPQPPARSSLRPLNTRRAGQDAKLGDATRRENAGPCPRVVPASKTRRNLSLGKSTTSLPSQDNSWNCKALYGQSTIGWEQGRRLASSSGVTIARVVELHPVLSDVLKRKDLYDFFSRSAFEKAHVYQAQGRVQGLEVSEDLTHVRARVRGSGSNKYRVDIQLEFSGDRLSDLDGECSCPMSFNCKHVAATLLEATSGKPLSAPKAMAAEQEAAALPPVLGYEVVNWLENVGNAVRGDDYPAELNQRLLYRLHPSGEGVKTPLLAVSLLSVRVLKGGDFGGNYAQPNASDFSPERAPKYYRDTDIEIVSQLSAASRGSLLRHPAAFGRAIAADRHDRPRLLARPQTTAAAVGKQRVRGGSSGARSASVASFLACSCRERLRSMPSRRSMSTSSAGTIGPVELSLPPKLARQLLSAPEIPRDQAHGSIASSWPTSAGTSSRPAAGSASGRSADRRAARPDIAPAAGPDEREFLLLP